MIMKPQPDQSLHLKDIEKSAFRSTFDDGLWDIFIGTMLLTFGMSRLFDDIGFSVVISRIITTSIMLLSPLILIVGKRFITTPRIGLVNFSGFRIRKIMRVHLIVVVAVCLTFLLLGVSLSASDEWGPQWLEDRAGDIVIAMMVIAIYSGMGYYLSFERFYPYGVIFALFITSYSSPDSFGLIPPATPFLLCSLLIIVFGLHVLREFMKNNPIPNDDEKNIDELGEGAERAKGRQKEEMQREGAERAQGRQKGEMQEEGVERAKGKQKGEMQGEEAERAQGRQKGEMQGEGGGSHAIR